MSDIIKASMEGIREFSENDTVLGRGVTTPQGVTIIPISKITVGQATGGVDYGAKRFSNSQSFGGGGGVGMSITPMAFIAIDSEKRIQLVNVSNGESDLSKVGSLIEKSPEIIEKIRSALS